MIRHSITEEQARSIMSAGDIPEVFRRASARVAVVLTQGWCPQWRAMDSFLSRMESDTADGHGDLTVFDLVYDRLPFFPAFLDFKETRFNNYSVPYVRYYRDGKFTAASNYVSETGFFSLFGG
jgi:hypothetical protein